MPILQNKITSSLRELPTHIRTLYSLALGHANGLVEASLKRILEG